MAWFGWTDHSWEESERFVRACESLAAEEIAECHECPHCTRKEREDDDET